jgi:ribonucleoside-diphosphate reductase alpha chain
MMAAVQPFLSGAISKTVNMPEEVTVEDIEQLHMEAWKLGLKAVAIYRDNCKVGQPLSMAKKETKEEAVAPSLTAHVAESPQAVAAAITESAVPRATVRREMPNIRNSKTFSFKVSDSKGFFTVGEFEDGTPGEIFISTAKMGSTLRGLMDAFAISISHGLQYGVPLKTYVGAFSHMSFAPSGITNDPDIRTASSLVDYIFRRMAITYLSFDDRLELGLASLDDMPSEHQTTLLDESVAAAAPQDTPSLAAAEIAPEPVITASTQPEPEVNEAPAVSSTAKATVQDASAPLCFNCGNQTQRAGTCYVCTACGSTTGCS